jgi:hypothetical protein
LIGSNLRVLRRDNLRELRAGWRHSRRCHKDDVRTHSRAPWRLVGASGRLHYRHRLRDYLLIKRETFDRHALATLATWLITLVIKRAEHCDAIPTKPDELLRADGAAQNNLTTLDDKEPEEIERHRKFARAGS